MGTLFREHMGGGNVIDIGILEWGQGLFVYLLKAYSPANHTGFHKFKSDKVAHTKIDI